MTHSSIEMANVFNNHFVNVYTSEDVSSIPSFHLEHEVPTLDDVEVTPAIVLHKLESIDVNKSSGPDSWPLLWRLLYSLVFHCVYCLESHSVVDIFLAVGNMLMSHQFTRRAIVLMPTTTVQ